MLISVGRKPPTLYQSKQSLTAFPSGKPLMLSPCWAMITVSHDAARHRYPYHIIVQHKLAVEVLSIRTTSKETHFSKQGGCLSLVKTSVF